MADLLGYGGEVLFRMHNNGVFEFGPLRYVQGNVSTMCGFVCDRHVFFLGLDDMFSRIRGEKWDVFFCVPGKSLEEGLKLIHTDNDVHTMIELGCYAGFVDLFVPHTKQVLSPYYLNNIDAEGDGGEVVGWVEEDASLRCSITSTPFRTSTSKTYRKVDDVDASQPEFGKHKKRVKRVKRSVDKGKGKMVDEVDEADVVNRNKPAGIVIRDGGSMKNPAGVGSVNVGAKGGGILRPRITNCVLGLRAPRSMGNNVVLF